MFKLKKLISAIQADDSRAIQVFFREPSNKRLIDNLFCDEKDFNNPINNFTPLTYAARAGKANALRALLTAGANPNVPNKNRIPPLMTALAIEAEFSVKQQLLAEIYQALLENHAATDIVLDDGATLLALLAQDGYVKAAKILLHYAPVLLNIPRSSDENTPLNLAVIYGHLPMVQLLRECNADINKGPSDGTTLWHHLALNSINPMEIASELLKWPGISGIDTPDKKGHTPLMHASHAGNVRLIGFLLNQGADTTTLTHDQLRSPINYVIESQNIAALGLFRNKAIGHPKIHPVKTLSALKMPPDMHTLYLNELTRQGYALEEGNPSGEKQSAVMVSDTYLAIRHLYEFYNSQPIFKRLEPTTQMRKSLIDFLRLVDVECIEALSCEPLFYEILRLCNIIYTNKELITFDFFQACLKFFYDTQTVLPEIEEDCLFHLAHKDFYKNIEVELGKIFRKEDVINSFEKIINLLSIDEDGKNFYKTHVGQLTETFNDVANWNEIKNNSSIFMERVAALSSDNLLNNQTKVGFFLVHLNVFNRLHQAYIKEKKETPAELVDEFFAFNDIAKKELSLLGKNYKIYQPDFLLWETVEKAFEKLDVELYEKNLAKEKIDKKEKKSKNLATNKNKGEEPKALSPKPSQSSAEKELSAEEIAIRIQKSKEDKNQKQALEKKEQDYYLKLRMQARQVRKEEKIRLSNAISSPVPASRNIFKWTEKQVREIYSTHLQPYEVIIPLHHPNVTAAGTFWGCFTVTPEQFENPQEYPLYAQKFAEGKITLNIKATGIIYTKGIFYLRIDKHLPRMHVHVHEMEGDAPKLLKADEYQPHTAHLTILNAEKPAERYGYNCNCK